MAAPARFHPAFLLALLAASPQAQPLFTDVTATHLPPASSVGRNSMDVEAADLDADGDLDLAVPQEFLPNKLLWGDGTGGFTDGSGALPPSSPPNHDSEDVSIADFDGDGVLDVIMVSEDDVVLGRTDVHDYYRGGPPGTFTRLAGALPDTEANAVAHADLTGDGFPDLLIAGGGQDRLLVNDGGGGFTDETAARLPAESVVAQDAEFVDVDGDGDLDLVIGYEGGHALWINDGTARFTDETAARLPDPGNVEARKVTPVDLDDDGDLDLYFSHVGWEGRLPQDRLYLNDGTGHFADGTAGRIPTEALTTLDAKFADLDGDGDLDLVQAHFGPLVVLLNDGTGRFADATATVLPAPVNGPLLGVEIADFDENGWPDFYVAMLQNADPNAFDQLLLHTGTTTETEGGMGARPPLEWRGSAPNPFSDATTLRYALARPAHVEVAVYDTLGRGVAVLQAGRQEEGEHAVRWAAEGLPGGVYVCLVTADASRLARTLVRL
jgi:hypothetical protein